MFDPYAEMVDGTAMHFERSAEELASSFSPEATAHALSLSCRYNGHTKRFYSVAEHTYLMAKWVEEQHWSTSKDVLTALHHDDAEIVIGDMISPIKKYDQFFRDLEAKLDTAIAIQYGTEYPFPKWLKQVDSAMIKDERRSVMYPSDNTWFSDELTAIGVRFMPIIGRIPWLMRKLWLRMHYRLVNDILLYSETEDDWLSNGNYSGY